MNRATNIIGRGVIAGIAGSFVMTAFQKFIEMPLTKRRESELPAEMAEKLLPIHPSNKTEKRRLNYMTHFVLGAMWGAAYGVAAYKGLRGQRAVAWVFPAVFSNDIVSTTALGLTKPWKWTAKGTAIDAGDKMVQMMATSFIFDRFLDPQRQRKDQSNFRTNS